MICPECGGSGTPLLSSFACTTPGCKNGPSVDYWDWTPANPGEGPRGVRYVGTDYGQVTKVFFWFTGLAEVFLKYDSNEFKAVYVLDGAEDERDWPLDEACFPKDFHVHDGQFRLICKKSGSFRIKDGGMHSTHFYVPMMKGAKFFLQKPGTPRA